MNRIVELATVVNGLAERVARAISWFPPLVARLIVGIVFVQSGWGKLHAIDGVTDFFRELGIPYPEIQAPLSAANELLFGALVLLGVATRFTVVPLIVIMLVAIKTAIWPNLETTSAILNASEFLYIALLLWLGTYGAGTVSVDALFNRTGAVRETHPGGTGKMSRRSVLRPEC